MATVYTSADLIQVIAKIECQLRRTRDCGDALATVAGGQSKALTFGTGADKSDECFDDIRILASATPEDLNVLLGLTNGVGAALALAKVHAILVWNRSGETDPGGVAHVATAATVKVEVSAANALLFLDTAADSRTLGPGDMLLLYSAAGITVDGTHKLITFTPSAAEAAYQVIVLGEAA